jgi:predicted aldo/keto reductase-like oxidoreductase
MKTTRGAGRMSRDPVFMKDFPAGTTPHQALARWLTTGTQLDAAVIQINSLSQFADSYSGAGRALGAAGAEAIRRMAAYADREVCRLCNQCAGACGRRIPIADILRYERYAVDYLDVAGARQLYRKLDIRADACVRCDSCVVRCPQLLQIPEKLAQTHPMLA